MLGMKKEVLDQYLIISRFGRKFNFDFERNKNLNFEVLKQFVKEKREKEI